jgi:CDGSH-type Zn-finger protein
VPDPPTPPATAPDPLPSAGRSDTQVTISTYPDGPLIVRGPFVLQDHLGVELQNTRSTIALCRCGKSAIKPFCDGTHKLRRERRTGTTSASSAT